MLAFIAALEIGNLPVFSIGVLLMLCTFMADAIKSLPADIQTLNQIKPTAFNWPVFILGYGLTVFATIVSIFTKSVQDVE